jgi:hypothetical protein
MPTTLKRKRFVTAYLLNGGNGRQAAEEAGFRGNPHTLAQTAHEILMNPDIQAALREPLESEDVLRERVIRELKSLAFTQPTDSFGVMAKLRSLELLAKCLGSFKKSAENRVEPEENYAVFDVHDANPQQLWKRLQEIQARQGREPAQPLEEALDATVDGVGSDQGQ